jgi:hypothetical protein
MSAFAINQIIAWILFAALIYSALGNFGLLPEGAPMLLPRSPGPPSP